VCPPPSAAAARTKSAQRAARNVKRTKPAPQHPREAEGDRVAAIDDKLEVIGGHALVEVLYVSTRFNVWCECPPCRDSRGDTVSSIRRTEVRSRGRFQGGYWSVLV